MTASSAAPAVARVSAIACAWLALGGMAWVAVLHVEIGLYGPLLLVLVPVDLVIVGGLMRFLWKRQRDTRRYGGLIAASSYILAHTVVFGSWERSLIASDVLGSAEGLTVLTSLPVAVSWYLGIANALAAVVLTVALTATRTHSHGSAGAEGGEPGGESH